MVWGAKPAGAWADNVEEEEAAGTLAPPPAAFPVLGAAKRADDDFPDLSAAAKVKESKKDKKKKEAKQKLSLTDFLKSDVGGGGSTAAFGASRRGGGGDVDLLSLPTAPRPRAEGEEPAGPRLGGAFGGFGGREGGRGRFGDDDRRPGREEDQGPSRAEMSDNWGADRKFAPNDDRGRGGFGGGFREREGGFREGGFRDRSREGGFGDGPSRADEVDDWGKTKSYVPSSRGGFEDRPRGGGGFGGGFRERSPGGFREPSRADTEDRWSRASGGDFKPTAFEDRPRREFDDRPPRRGGFGFGERDGSRDASRDRWERAPREGSREGRPPPGRDLSQERTWRRADAPPAAADEAPRERRKLTLAPRSAVAAPAAAAGASKASVFGAARPREEVLKEQGRDAVKEDLKYEHEAVDRPETAEEKALRQEITNLQIRVEAGEADAEFEEEGEEGGKTRTVAQALEELEARLTKLQLELDAKAKYARATDRERGDRSTERAPAAREPSPGGWRRGAPADANGGGAAPRGFRDDRPRPTSRGGPEERRGGGGFEERGRRDNFLPRDRDASRDKPRW
ncbi:hypothetical protein ABPG75_012814 [Micractinium tetrahymenae]